ncbi:MAG: 1-acyl-sn-glycerol-3-phosphate acyltransferase [Ketobacter sp.]|nr:MAG: 1-acyl-sn-glycerol-3-phosphate acyltransferase [Ketobacter sp.]
MNIIRGLIFNLFYSMSVILISVPVVLIGPFIGFRGRTRFFVIWTQSILWYLRIICGIRVRVIGQENIPTKPLVIVSNHQSTWETYALYHLLYPVCTVLKKELTYIPIFGWLLRWSRPIVIDRKKKATAMKEILRQGQNRLSDGLSVLIFPEGTRVPTTDTRSHMPGGAMLAVKSGVAVLPVVHNAGQHWPAHQLAKIPGEIVVKIGEPVSPVGKSAKELNAQLEQWLNTEKQLLLTNES